jgi:hypothetical protein
MMPVSRSGRKADACPRPYNLATRVRYEHKLALQHIDELVLSGMCVTGGGLTARLNANEIDTVVLDPCVVAQAPVVALSLRVSERLGIT